MGIMPNAGETGPVHIRGRTAVCLDRVLRRLESLHPLSPDAIALIRSLQDTQTHRAGAELNREGSTLLRPRFLLTGWAACVRLLSDGRRQIIGLILPGEPIGLCLKPHPLALAATIALTPLTTVEARPVLNAMRQAPAAPGLCESIDLAARMREALLLDQIVRLGRQTAYERICHLLLELRDRLSDVGLVRAGSWPLPLTQEMLADALGLSIVHVNRTMKQLRQANLLDLRHGYATLPDPETLQTLANYQRPQPMTWH